MESAKSLSKDDLTDISIYLDHPFIRIESPKIKTKTTTCKEEIIASNVIPKMKTVLNPTLEFTTSPNLIKSLNAHSFVFQKKEDGKIYLSEDLKCILKNTLINHYSRMSFLTDKNDDETKFDNNKSHFIDIII